VIDLRKPLHELSTNCRTKGLCKVERCQAKDAQEHAAQNMCRHYSEPQFSPRAAPSLGNEGISGSFSLRAMSAVDHTESRDISHGCGGSSRRSFAGVLTKAGNCLNALSVKCALISPYVIMQMDFEICDIVPQQRSSAAVIAQVCKALRKFRGTSPMLC
jgi:hypothetical protein